MAKRNSPRSSPSTSGERMVPRRSLEISVEEAALRIFTRTYMETSGKTLEHLASVAFDAAEEFVRVAESRIKNPESAETAGANKGNG